jgi:hypothetical protein
MQTKDYEMTPHVIPALPGFWLHMPTIEDDGTVVAGARMAVVSWIIETRYDRGTLEWSAISTPVTADGGTQQEYFIEQPDGSCVHVNFWALSVEDAFTKVAEDAAEDAARAAARKASLSPDSA